MGAPGIGVMIHQLFDDNRESAEACKAAFGKRIASIVVSDSAVRIALADGSVLRVWDDGQSCCEQRYMRSDDRPEDHVGSTLLGLELRDAPPVEGEYGDCHDVQFLDVKTSNGVFTCSSHNEHNGYYGGFWLQARMESAPSSQRQEGES